MNQSAMTTLVYREVTPRVSDLAVEADRVDATDQAIVDIDDIFPPEDVAFPMGVLVERLRARFDWSWDVIDCLTDEQLQVLAFSVENER